MMLNSAQHARSAASRLDDVIDRSALEQAREGLGGRDMEEAAHLDSESRSLRGERAAALHAIRGERAAALHAIMAMALSPRMRTPAAAVNVRGETEAGNVSRGAGRR